MRFFLISVVTATCSLVTLPAFAEADIEVRLPGNDGGSAEILSGDPAGLSGVLHASIDNAKMDTSSFSEAATDATAGTMRCKIAAHLTQDNVVVPICESDVSDTITFHGPAGPVSVLLTLVTDGTVTASVSQVDHQIRGKYASSIGFTDPTNDTVIAQSMAQTIYDYQLDGGTVTSTITDGGGFINTVLDSQTTTLHARATVTVGVPVEIDAYLEVNDTLCAGFTDDTLNMDFGNTARLTIDLPAGYTFTSDSGNFLTNPGAPGLGLPPDGGVGVTGLGDAGVIKDGGGASADGGGDASIIVTDGGGSSSPDGGDGATNDGSGDDGGCNSAGSTSSGYGAAFAIAAFALIAKRRRRGTNR